MAGVEGLERAATAEGAIVLPLAEAAAEPPRAGRASGSAPIVPASDAFTARNEARWRDGVFVHVPAGDAARASRCG